MSPSSIRLLSTRNGARIQINLARYGLDRQRSGPTRYCTAIVNEIIRAGNRQSHRTTTRIRDRSGVSKITTSKQGSVASKGK